VREILMIINSKIKNKMKKSISMLALVAFLFAGAVNAQQKQEVKKETTKTEKKEVKAEKKEAKAEKKAAKKEETKKAM
jgi:nitrate reductase cytochrome c-type subunit